ncbi:MAG: DUF3109 family protein [Chlorobiaceae bacterium]|jgi:hypothetical protein|nr:DUF3109 family protein [Chlorobiaceae bacterium]
MSLVSIGQVLVDKEVLRAFFCCDLHQCKGMCCVEGELGAPLHPLEATQLEQISEEVVRMLPEKNIRYLRRHGAVELYQGSHYTKTIENKECVFSFFENGITWCVLEKAFHQGLIKFDKPISCRLFPIRVRKKYGLDYLVYEKLPMCSYARSKGRECGVKLVDYLSRGLVELYGDDWTGGLKTFADSSSDS